MKKREIKGADYKTKIDSQWIADKAESHLEAWKERYDKYRTKAQARFDLNVNHDISLEIESAEEDLERKLNSVEYADLESRFNIKVVKMFNPNRRG